MDTSVAYVICFLLTLILSWASYRYVFKDSDWEDKVSEQMQSLRSFLLYSAVLLVLFFAVLYTNNDFLGSLLGGLLGRRHGSIGFGGQQDIQIVLFSFAFVFLGLILLQYGFLKMSEFQLTRNVPRSKIRSAAIGLVEIQAKVIPDQLLTTPYSKLECVYYRSELQEYVRRYTSNSGVEYEWKTISTNSLRLPFWAKDETGQILIDPGGAEFEIPQMQMGFLGRDGDAANDLSFIPSVGDKRYNEYYLSPNEDVCVLGSVAVRHDASIHKVIQKGSNNSTFIISGSTKKELNDALKWQMLAGLSYGSSMFIVGLIKILQLSDLL
jgi:E3 Ubiquitin ligase